MSDDRESPGLSRGEDVHEPGDRGRTGPTLLFEQRLWRRGVRHVAGVDEAGRGPLAGPVVAAAVLLRADTAEWELAGCDDSKRLAPSVRRALVARIQAVAGAWAVAEVDVPEIDRLNIAVASFEAMRRAVATLVPAPEHVLVDGLPNTSLLMAQTAVVGGDGLCLSVAAASILAKVHRDELMLDLDRRYPGYGFAEHKGYPTPQHRQALEALGPCPAHRRSFRLLGRGR